MFKNMKIQKKFFVILLVFSIIMAVPFYIIINNKFTMETEAEITAMKLEEYKDRKHPLKNYVDVAYKIIEENYHLAKDNTYLEKKYGPRLQHIIELSYSIIESKKELVKQGVLTVEEAQKESARIIENLRYDNGTGYVWINDTQQPFPKMIMHPTVPALNDTYLDLEKYNCALGIRKNLFVAMCDVCLEKGHGFVDYLWPKPTSNGLTEDQPKLSYVKLIPEWNWIIGTGIYIDDAQKDAMTKSVHDIEKMRYENGHGYFWINNDDKPYPKMIMHPVLPELNGKILNNPNYNCVGEAKENLFVKFADVCESAGHGFVEYVWPKPTDNGVTEAQPKLSYVKAFKEYGWILGTGTYTDDIEKEITRKSHALRSNQRELLKNIMIYGCIAFLLLVAVIYIELKNVIIKPLHKIVDIAQKISSGDISQKIDIENSDEIGELAKSFSEVSTDFNDIIKTVSDISMNLDNEIQKINEMNTVLVDNSAQQASALEQISASMEEIATQTEMNSSNAGNANELVKKTRRVAKAGNIHMQDLSQSMKEIDDSSQQIAKIIKVIDEIAFQTNLLALNAAVEAARAGVHGKGFAVVAEEVRNLAQRSAVAAKETEQLIATSIAKVENGLESTHKTEISLKNIVDRVDKAAELISEITEASEQQVEGFNQVNRGLTEIDHNAQQTAANAYDTAQVSQDIKVYAKELKNSLKKFKVEIKQETMYQNTNDIQNDHFKNMRSNTESEIKATDIIPLDPHEQDDDFSSF